MKIANRLLPKKNRWQRYYLAPFVGVALLSASILPAIADGTEAGLTIDNTAYGSFASPSAPDTPIDIQSNTVTLTVAEIAGIDVAATGGQEAPGSAQNAGPAQGDGIVSAEDVVYYTFRVTNIGNDQTQFFIPEAPASVTNATFDTATTGRIRVVGYNDGSVGATTTAVDIPIPDGGLATGAGALGAGLPNNGSVPIGGFVDVRIPVKVNPAVTTGNVTVVFGNTTDVASQNEPVSATNEFAGANDVTTQDNPDGAGVAPGDLAGGPNTEREASDLQDVPVGTPELDYGDAPDAGGATGPGNYQTAPGRGPSHVVDNSLRLGSVVDDETTDGNDNDYDNNNNEDDGVQLDDGSLATFQGVSLIAGQNFDLDIATTGTGVLNAWIDFNGDGNFDDDDENIIVDEASTGGAVDLNDLLVPFDALPGTTYARFRYSTVDTAGGMTSTSAAPDGEVEDYQITIVGAKPNLRLVKRVTRLGATDTTPVENFTAVTDEAGPDDDPSINWPSNTYLQGVVIATPEPGQEVDYTVYFLSDGNSEAANVRLCDLIPDNTTYKSGTLFLSLGTAGPVLQTDSDVATDTDPGSYYFDSATPVTTPCTGANTDGGVYVTLPNNLPNATAANTPDGSYGFIRFTVTVD